MLSVLSKVDCKIFGLVRTDSKFLNFRLPNGESFKKSISQLPTSTNRLTALSANIRLRKKWVPVANTLAYYDRATITAVKSWNILR